jgi:hypothetical protein
LDEDPRTWQSVLRRISETIMNQPETPSDGIAEALQTLAEIWEPIPEEVKFMCRPYFNFTDSTASEGSDNDNEASASQESQP